MLFTKLPKIFSCGAEYNVINRSFYEEYKRIILFAKSIMNQRCRMRRADAILIPFAKSKRVLYPAGNSFFFACGALNINTNGNPPIMMYTGTRAAVEFFEGEPVLSDFLYENVI